MAIKQHLIKRLFIIFQLLVAGVACSDETRQNTPDYPIYNFSFPVENTYWTDEDVVVQGKGLKTTDQIWLETIISDEPDIPGKIQVTNIEIFPDSFLFTTPLTVTGTFKVILKRHGKEFYLGTIIIKARLKKGKNLYTIRNNKEYNKYEVIKINKNTGLQEVIADIPDIGFIINFQGLLFIHSTQEIIYVIGSIVTNKLIKIQVHTGKINVINLQEDCQYASIFLDNSENLYAIIFNSSYQKQLIKMNPVNGEHQVIISIDNNNWPRYHTVYKASTNEIISITEDFSNSQYYLEKTSIQTEKTEMIPLNEHYQDLWIDNHENLYTTIPLMSGNTQLQRIDDSGIAKETIANTPEHSMLNAIDYNSAANEFIVLLSLASIKYDIWRINIPTKEIIPLPLEGSLENPVMPKHYYYGIACD